MMKSDCRLDFSVEDRGWRQIFGLRTRLARAAEVALAHLPKAMRFPCAVTVLLTHDRAMRRLNRDFRGIDRPTNVLSFPQFSPRELTKMGKNGTPVYSGDIALGYQYIVAEAEKDHKILINHVTHLLIHGILHLFGYDHGTNAEAARMERLEKQIMAELGLPDPYKPPKPRRAPRKTGRTDNTRKN